MARPLKQGLQYWPINVFFFYEEDIRYICSLFGHDGEVVVLRLLCKIFERGYYLPWNRDQAILFSQELKNISVEKVQKIIRALVKRNFFDKNLKKNFEILTSATIQKTYINICNLTKRKINFNTQFLVSSEEMAVNSELMGDEIEDGVSSEFFGINSAKEKKNKRKEIKENDIKENKIGEEKFKAVMSIK